MWTTTIDQASILLNMIYFVLAAPYLAYALYTTCESLQNTSRCTVILASLSLSVDVQSETSAKDESPNAHCRLPGSLSSRTAGKPSDVTTSAPQHACGKLLLILIVSDACDFSSHRCFLPRRRKMPRATPGPYRPYSSLDPGVRASLSLLLAYTL